MVIVHNNVLVDKDLNVLVDKDINVLVDKDFNVLVEKDFDVLVDKDFKVNVGLGLVTTSTSSTTLHPLCRNPARISK